MNELQARARQLAALALDQLSKVLAMAAALAAAAAVKLSEQEPPP